MAEVIAERMTPDALLAELRIAGADVTRPKAIRCPWHEDKHASAGIYQRPDGAWAYKCHVCGINEDFLGIRARNQKRSVDDVVAEYVKGDAPRVDWSGRSKSKDQTEPTSSLATMNRRELESKLPGKIEIRHVYGPRNNPVMIVYRCRTADGKTFRQVKRVGDAWAFGAVDKPWPLYAADQLAEADRVVVVEGEKCADRLNAIGVVATTSPCGAGKAEHADWSPMAGKSVVLWPDHDQAGESHMKDVRERLLALDPPASVAVVRPDGLGLDEKSDAADFIDAIDDASVVVDAVETVLDTALPAGVAAEFDDYIEAMIRGEFRCEPWPWDTLTQATAALRPGAISIVCGQPEAGKSIWLLQCLLYWMGRGLKVAAYELEGDRNEHLLRALAMLAENSKLAFDWWIRANPDASRSAWIDHRTQVAKLGERLWHSPASMVSVNGIVEWIDQRAAEGCRIICVDPITAVEASSKPWLSDQKLLMAAQRAAVTHKCSVIFVTHPKLGVKGAASLDHLAGGAAYSRFSQCVLVLVKHEPPEEEMIRTQFGALNQSFHRSVYIRKARHSFGGGYRFAYDFSKDRLAFSCLGLVQQENEK